MRLVQNLQTGEVFVAREDACIEPIALWVKDETVARRVAYLRLDRDLVDVTGYRWEPDDGWRVLDDDDAERLGLHDVALAVRETPKGAGL